jgi:hypothetical protein
MFRSILHVINAESAEIFHAIVKLRELLSSLESRLEKVLPFVCSRLPSSVTRGEEHKREGKDFQRQRRRGKKAAKVVKLCTVSSYKSNFDNFLKVVVVVCTLFAVLAFHYGYDHITKHLTAGIWRERRRGRAMRQNNRKKCRKKPKPRVAHRAVVGMKL